mmetsp:Transcript_3779/g.6425  ORF Transcript_3779/g.6425 Transcript_3779/m.6425 type:complete len:355 (+) Transcript_3779:249-1313(+)
MTLSALRQLVHSVIVFLFFLPGCACVWQNEAFAKHPTYLKRLQTAAHTPVSLHSALLRTRTHVYAIVTKAAVRQNHMRNFVTTALQLPFDDTNHSSPFDLVAAVEISPQTPFHSFVLSGVLSWDYNATWRHQRMNRGRLACQLSLVHTLQLFLNSSHKHALIFEDDVAVTGGLSSEDARSLTAQMLQLPGKQWDVQYLGYCHSCQSRGSLHASGWLSDDVIALCAHAIVFNRKAAATFLRRWSPIHVPGDNKLTHVICQTGLKVLRPVLPIFDQDRSIGLSQTGTKNKPLLPFLEPDLCRARQMNCPSVLAAQVPPPPRVAARSWFGNSGRGEGKNRGRGSAGSIGVRGRARPS